MLRRSVWLKKDIAEENQERFRRNDVIGLLTNDVHEQLQAHAWIEESLIIRAKRLHEILSLRFS